jgi:hypothetical protein
MSAKLPPSPPKALLDSVQVDRYAAIATLVSPALGWLRR